MEGSVRFDPDLVRRYDVPGPRYTSYPTAVQFTEDFGADDYRRAARASNEDPIPRALSLYAHVPFCTSPCFYCGCTKVITRDRGAGARYLTRLAREVELQSKLFDRDRRVTQLHLGGGTPTFLSPDELTELMQMLHSGFQLVDDESREYSIEVDPRTASDEMLAALAGLGFNRISLGVQDFDPLVQAAVNRVQPQEDVLEVIGGARHHGFGSIAVDLIYGLPRQTVESFARTLDAIVAVRPERIAAYSYAHLPQLFKPQTQIKLEDLCPPEVKLALLGLTIEKLTAAGYVYVGMDHFAVPEDELSVALGSGSLQRNFQGYSTRAGLDMIGLGMSAIGQVGDCYAQNRKTLDGWMQALDAGELPVWRGLRMSGEDRLRRDVIQQLMCSGQVDFADVEQRYELDFAAHFASELARLAPLADDGLIELGPRSLHVTPLGRLLVRAVAMVFDAYLLPHQDNGVKRFSRVV
jgi:oxygen-independent coproporphyrinogen-3 oxidase